MAAEPYRLEVAEIRAPDKCMRCFLGDNSELEQGRAKALRWHPQSTFLETASKCVLKQKLAFQAKAPGQRNFVHRKNGVCVSIYSILLSV